MADIKQAAKWMREGKTVQSFDSGRGTGMYLAENERFYMRRTGLKVNLTIEDIEAEDWEVVE